MPTTISDEPAWVKAYPPFQGFKPPTIRESLAKGFDDGAVFYLHDERPIAIWPDLALAVDFSQYPTREVRASELILSGTKITEWQFRTLVCALHGILK
jgi:hypothetical protein